MGIVVRGGRREERGEHGCSPIHVHVCDSLGLGNTSVTLQYTNIQDMLIYKPSGAQLPLWQTKSCYSSSQ